MRRLPEYRALLGRSRVRGAVAPVEIPPSTEAERGASPLTENVESPPSSPGSPEMFTRTDTIRTLETTIRTRSEDIVREVLNFPAEARPSCNRRSGDVSQPSGDDGGR